MTFSRREFIKLAGVSAAAAALYESSGSILRALSLIDQTTPPGEEVWAPSVCQLCPAECGLRVRVVGGLVVKVEGNPLHPLNQGKPCPRAQAALQVLYDPDRIREPLPGAPRATSGNWLCTPSGGSSVTGREERPFTPSREAPESIQRPSGSRAAAPGKNADRSPPCPLGYKNGGHPFFACRNPGESARSPCG